MRENTIRINLQTIDNCLLRLDEQSARNTRMLAQLRHAAGIQGSPPSWENPGLGDGGGQKVRDRGTPPQRLYNEDKLRPFTDYRGVGRQRPPLQHGMSIDRTEFEQRYGGMLDGSRIRQNSIGQSEESAAQPGKKTASAPVADSRPDPGNPDHQHAVQPDIPDGAVPPRYSRSLSVGRSGNSGALSLRTLMPVMPMTPIVTPTRMEYTSITDAIDTSCIERPTTYSPPNTPEFKPRSRRGSGPTHRKKAGHHHQHKHRHKRRTEASLNEGLRTAEENEHKQMEVSGIFFLCVSVFFLPGASLFILSSWCIFSCLFCCQYQCKWFPGITRLRNDLNDGHFSHFTIVRSTRKMQRKGHAVVEIVVVMLLE